jgi:RNA-directed DNA polymerase
MHSLQEELINSPEGRLLATKRVTQDNKGKNTAGIDKMKSLGPKQRLDLASRLKLSEEASKIRRVWIPKPGRTEKRPP